MTTHSVYIWLDGKKLDLELFRKSLPASKRGTIAERRSIAVRALNCPMRFWQTEVLTAEKPEEALRKLIVKYGHTIHQARKLGADRIYAEIVTRRGNNDPIGGYYLPSRLIALLAQNDISVDIDIVRQLS